MPWTDVLIALVVLAVPICIVNVILIILVCNRGRLGKLENALLLSLGCSDFCAGFFAIPCMVLCTLFHYSPAGCRLCIVSYLLNRFLMVLSLLHLTAVIFERYLKIVHPFWYQQHEYTVVRPGRCVLALWCISVLIAAVPLTWWPMTSPCHPGDETARNIQYFDYACLALFCLLLAVMIYAFARIFRVVRTHLPNIHGTTTVPLRLFTSESSCGHSAFVSGRHFLNANVYGSPRRAHSTAESSVHELSKNRRSQLLLKEVKVVIRFAAMVLMFILAWGFYFCLSMLETKGREDIPFLLRHLVTVIRFANPLIDPFILTVNNSSFRPSYDYLKVIISRLICCPRVMIPRDVSGYHLSSQVRVGNESVV